MINYGKINLTRLSYKRNHANRLCYFRDYIVQFSYYSKQWNNNKSRWEFHIRISRLLSSLFLNLSLLFLSLSLEITFPIIEYSDSALAFHVSVSQPSLSNHSRTKNVVQHFNNYYLSLDCAERVKIYRRKYINNIFLLNTNKCV